MFKNLLDKMKSFKYQITLKVLLNKYKEHRDREFTTTVYFNFTTKTVTGSENSIEKSFQECF